MGVLLSLVAAPPALLSARLLRVGRYTQGERLAGGRRSKELTRSEVAARAGHRTAREAAGAAIVNAGMRTKLIERVSRCGGEGAGEEGLAPINSM